MREVNERDYLGYLGDENIIIWTRGHTQSHIVFVRKGEDGLGQISLKESYHTKFIIRRGVLRRFFLLTDEEVERMVLPRLI